MGDGNKNLKNKIASEDQGVLPGIRKQLSNGTSLKALNAQILPCNPLPDNDNDNDNGPGRFPPAAGARPFIPASTNAVSGASSFKILDLTRDEAIAGFFKVLFGEVAGTHVRGMIGPEYCDQVNERFQTSPFRKPRKDGVPGNEWGPTQYGKKPSELAYLAYEQEGNYRHLVGGYENPILAFIRNVATAAVGLGITVRPAVYAAQPLVILRAVQWTKTSGKPRWLLKLHDDWAQVTSVQNDGFEIQQVVRLVAFNFYIQSTPGSGQLVAYDWRPTDDDRRRLDVVDTGYPYNEADIPAGTKTHMFDQASGDLILLDGSYVHGVLVGEDRLPGRLIINGFAALLRDGTVALFA
jgi:hypothetical protein